MFIIISLLVSVALFFLTALLAPSPDIEDARPGQLEDFDFPTATEGRAIPVLWGSVQVKGPNATWFGDLQVVAIREKIKTGLFKSEYITVGHQYFVGFDLAICLGQVDFISEIEIGDASVHPETFPQITAGGAATGVGLYLTNTKAWGGYKEGGGLHGYIRMYDGATQQDPDPYLIAKVNQIPTWAGAPGPNYSLPGYNGVCHIVWYRGMTGESTQVRPWSLVVHRFPNSLGLTLSKHIVQPDAYGRGDANIACVIYDILTNTDFGLSVPASAIEIAEFTAAGNTLFDENNGFSLVFNRQKKARELIKELERQANGVLFQTADGRFHFKLLRDDYNHNTLQLFDESNLIEVQEFTRAAWGETQNSVSVKYSDRTDSFKNTSAVAFDHGNIELQGREAKAQLAYPGVKHPQTAADIAARELKQFGFPLARVTMVCNREAAQLLPGDVIEFSWARYNIDRMIMRVADISLGSLKGGDVKVICYQDIFGIPDTVFSGGSPSLGEDLDTDAVASVGDIIIDSTNWHLVHDPKRSADVTGERTMHFAKAPNQAVIDFDIHQSVGSGEYQIIGRSVGMATVGTLVANYGESAGQGGVVDATGFDIENVTWNQLPVDISDPLWNDLEGTINDNPPSSYVANSILAGEGMLMINGEILAYEDITDNGDGTWGISNVHRSSLDTAAENHSAGDIVWFIGEGIGSSSTAIDPAISDYKHQTRTNFDELLLASAPVLSHPYTYRRLRPYRPGFVKINGSHYPTDLTNANLTTTGVVKSTAESEVHLDIDSTTVPTPALERTQAMVVEYRIIDSDGIAQPILKTDVVNDPGFGVSDDMSVVYTRAAYLLAANGVTQNEQMRVTIYGRNTTPIAYDSHAQWVKQFDITDEALATISTNSISLNAGTPATDQQYVQGPALTSIFGADPTVISYSVWVQYNDASQIDLDMVLGGASNYSNWDDGFGMHVTGTNTARIWFDDASTGGYVDIDTSALFNGFWHHLAVTWDSTTNTIPLVWVDGVPETPTASNALATAVGRGTASFDLGRLGTINAASSSFIDIEFDEVAMYDSILAQKDVDKLYFIGVPSDINVVGPTADQLLWWRCGEDVSDDATAGSGQITDVGTNSNNHHGTPQAAVGNPVFTIDVP